MNSSKPRSTCSCTTTTVSERVTSPSLNERSDMPLNQLVTIIITTREKWYNPEAVQPLGNDSKISTRPHTTTRTRPRTVMMLAYREGLLESPIQLDRAPARTWHVRSGRVRQHLAAVSRPVVVTKISLRGGSQRRRYRRRKNSRNANGVAAPFLLVNTAIGLHCKRINSLSWRTRTMKTSARNEKVS